MSSYTPCAIAPRPSPFLSNTSLQFPSPVASVQIPPGNRHTPVGQPPVSSYTPCSIAPRPSPFLSNTSLQPLPRPSPVASVQIPPGSRHTPVGQPPVPSVRLILPTAPPMQTPPEPIFPPAYVYGIVTGDRVDFGSMRSHTCEDCAAFHWLDERANRSKTRPLFEKCCKRGAVNLATFCQPPSVIRRLLRGQHPQSAHFRSNIRQYNAALAFTSANYNLVSRGAAGPGYQVFQIMGELYHLQGPLDAHEIRNAAYAQLYFYDPNIALERRLDRAENRSLDRGLLGELMIMLEEECRNPWLQMYCTAHERLAAARRLGEDISIRLRPRLDLIVESGADRRRENLPVANEVGLLISEQYEHDSFRDLLLHERGSSEDAPQYSRVSYTHAAYASLHYVLLFPTGQTGWHWNIPLRRNRPYRGGNGEDRGRNRVSCRAFHRFHIHPRENVVLVPFAYGRLFQQYLVDCWAQIDQEKLNWFRMNQKRIRADLYRGVDDALQHEDFDPGAIGRRTVLPSSHLGSSRFVSQCYHDSMAIVRRISRPALFVTFTANPNWPELQREIDVYPGLTASDRPDLIARVFRLKLVELLRDLKEQAAFGRCVGLVYTIEYQKRGLPHAHILLFLEPEARDRFRDPAYVDQMIWAELPTPALDPTGRLSDTIKKTMVHGPCGALNPHAPCMHLPPGGSHSVCSKGYPKQFTPVTIIAEDGYPTYRRRDDGQVWEVGGRRAIPVDNRWVVPYSPFLSLRYDAHINVEVCATIRAVKYIHKYIYKGTDRITVVARRTEDEIGEHLERRYIGPTEAAWHLFEFPVHDEWPPVVRLTLHLPGEHVVMFEDDDTAEDVRSRADNARSTLMAWFEFNRAHAGSRHILYQDFPEQHVWKPKERVWSLRKQERFAIGRMHFCPPSAGERYYLRILLTKTPGATSFEDLRTWEGVLLPTFKEACLARNLLPHDRSWEYVFDELKDVASGYALRAVFNQALVFGDVSNPAALWDRYWRDICDDLPPQLAQRHYPADLADPLKDFGLFVLARTLFESYGETLDRYGMPVATHNWAVSDCHTLVSEQLNYDCGVELDLFEQARCNLNVGQAQVFEEVMAAVDSYIPGITTDITPHRWFFLQGPAGTGKTFLYRAICSRLRSQGRIVLCVASSGIAALLLPGGRTAHSRFKIPIKIDEESFCNFATDSPTAQLIRETSVIIWDETTMQHRRCFEAVDRSLRDVMQVAQPFGGIPVLFGGDFAQILPVVPKGGRSATVAACLQRSSLWSNIRVLRLTENMRMRGDQSNREYAEWILSVAGDGRASVPLLSGVQTFIDTPQFASYVYPDESLRSCTDPITTAEFFQHRCILSVRNDAVAEINDLLLDRFGGEESIFEAADVAEIDDGDRIDIPSAEFLASLNPASLPPSRLRLKVGVPVMLLRNLDPTAGLCNGTRLVITRIGARGAWVEGRILGGDFSGQLRFLARVKLIAEAGDLLPFPMARYQIPIRLCFAMSINKSQGQSIRIVGVDLRNPVFTHGQLYVALSRVTSVSGISVLLPSVGSRNVTNVVYPEVLL